MKHLFISNKHDAKCSLRTVQVVCSYRSSVVKFMQLQFVQQGLRNIYFVPPFQRVVTFIETDKRCFVNDYQMFIHDTNTELINLSH